MAEVWCGQHTALGHAVALKELTVTKPVVVERFLAEGRHQAQLRHANVLRVHDVLLHHDVPVLVLDYVGGPTLEVVIARLALAPDEAVGVATAIARGVAAAHARGLVHRDLKPGNVLLDVSEGKVTPKVADFGIAKAMGAASVTRSGAMMGTPAYMSPEQARSEPADVRSDVFALGVILYELVAGVRAFPQESLGDLLDAVCRVDRVPLAERRPDQTRVAALVDRCMSLSPDDRPADAGVLLQELEALGGVPLRPDRVAHLVRAAPETLAPEALAPEPSPPTVDAGTITVDETPPTARRWWPWVAGAAVGMGIGLGLMTVSAAVVAAVLAVPGPAWQVVGGDPWSAEQVFPVGPVRHAAPGWLIAGPPEAARLHRVRASGPGAGVQVGGDARIVDSRGDTVLLAGQQAMVVAEGVVLEAPAPL
ncbi:MAG: hypothetical protein ACI9K2_006672, partial [Myxococcota bacterium]